MESITKGRVAEAKVVTALVQQGWEVFLPPFGNATCDIVAIDNEGKIFKIEVKYTSRRASAFTWQVSLRQTRANRKEMISKKFNAGNSDILAIYIAAEDKIHFMETSSLDGRTSINIGKEIMPVLSQIW